MTNMTSSSLCGAITYDAYFESTEIDGASSPMDYDVAGRTFGIYSEDLNLIGPREITVQAKLLDYPTVVSSIEIGSIEIIDPCLDPFSLTITP